MKRGNMRGQMTIFDILYPERLDPLREVARRAGPYWTTSRNNLIDFYETGPDIEAWTEAVRHEYSPYGYAGYYGGDDSPNTLQSYTMHTNDITIEYFDMDGSKQTIIRSWKDFAEKLAELIRSGEYKRREKDDSFYRAADGDQRRKGYTDGDMDGRHTVTNGSGVYRAPQADAPPDGRV